MKRREILGGCVIFLFGAVTAILSVQMPLGTFRAAGSGLFPLCLGILLMMLSAAFLVKVLWSPRELARMDASDMEGAGSARPVVAFLAATALATLLLNALGYLIVSFLLMAALLRILGSQRWALNLTVSLLTAACSHTLFVYLLKVPLPKGFLGI